MFLANERKVGMNNNTLTSNPMLRVLAVAAVCLALLGACGSADDSSSSPDATTESADSGAEGGSGSGSGDLDAYCEASSEMSSVAGPNSIPDGLEDKLKENAPSEVSGDIDTFFDLVRAGSLSDEKLIEVSRTIGEFHQANCA